MSNESKTIKEWFSSFPNETIKQNLLANLRDNPGQCKNAESMLIALRVGFFYSNTKEGFNYWQDVCDNWVKGVYKVKEKMSIHKACTFLIHNTEGEGLNKKVSFENAQHAVRLAEEELRESYQKSKDILRAVHSYIKNKGILAIKGTGERVTIEEIEELLNSD